MTISKLLTHFSSPTDANDNLHDRKRRVLVAARRLHQLRMESLRLYEPLSNQEPFLACQAPERILRGSNRSGKTLTAAIEIARAITGQDPHKKHPERDGRCFVVGMDGKHNSEVLFRKLFKPGAFRIILDAHTGLWRTWRPWQESDNLRKRETRPARPLVPPHMIKSISWENKAEGVPNLIRLTNGWEVRFFSSLGVPPQGSDIDLAWLDEEIVNAEWYPEISTRLLDRQGKFIWSATLQRGGPQLWELCNAAADMVNQGVEEPRLVEFFLHVNDNLYFTAEQRALWMSKLTDEQRRIRVEGESAFTGFKVYPEFNMRNVHGIDFFQIPRDWTRIMVVDPGRQICAVLFAAVPPPDHSLAEHVVFYDELYIRSCTAAKFGEKVREKTQGQCFYAFLIDSHGGRVREHSSGKTIELQYATELKKNDVRSQTTGHGFQWSSDDVIAGISAFRNWLYIGANGKPKLRVMRGKLPMLEWEMERYHYKRDPKTKELVEDPERRHNHLMDCCRYIAQYDPVWYEPTKKREGRTYGPLAALKRKLERARERGMGMRTVSLGPQERDPWQPT